MGEYFESVLLEAMLRCDGRFIKTDKGKFVLAYPFTTENINGYIRYFDLNNKSLLTIGSSGDQIINACLLGCQDITVVDINSYTKFYYYLKASCIIKLDFKEFCDFFCYRDYPKYCDKNKDVFSINTYNKIKSILRLLDYESYLFWDELFNSYSGEVIRENLFSFDEDNLSTLTSCNFFMSSEEIFNKTKEQLKKIRPKFIIGDIFDLSLDKKFDNIWLSNLGVYYKLNEFMELIHNIYNYLEDNGKLLMCYLYEYYKNSAYYDCFGEIYNLKKVFNRIAMYDYEFINFTGMFDIIYKENDKNDAMILIKKNRS